MREQVDRQQTKFVAFNLDDQGPEDHPLNGAIGKTRVSLLQPCDEWLFDGYLDVGWSHEIFERGLVCKHGCASVRREHQGTPVDVLLARDPPGAVLPAPAADIVSVEVADLLRPHLAGPVWGRCIDALDDSIIESHVTVYSPPECSALVKGGPHCRYRRCPTCGMSRINCGPRRTGKRRLDATGLAPITEAVQVEVCSGFAVSDRLRDELARLVPFGLEFDEMEIVWARDDARDDAAPGSEVPS